MLGFHVAEAGDVNAVWTAARGPLVGETAHTARRARPVVMIRHVTADEPARVGEAVGETRALRVEQQADRLDGRRAEKHQPPRVLALTHGLGVDHTDAAGPRPRVV